MRILILSFYYPPDLCAGSFRTGSLVSALSKKLPLGSEIVVITTLPNRYSSFSVDAPEFDKSGPVTIHRIKLPSHASGMIDQGKAFLSFTLKVVKIIRGERYDLVFATSSRLMTALLGSLISRLKRIPLYLDIRDIFADTIKEVLPSLAAVFASNFFSIVESFTMKRAQKINLVSQGFEAYFKERYPKKAYSFFTNGIDEEFLNIPDIPDPSEGEGKKIILYAGNLGEGQGLHSIIPQLAKKLENEVTFKIIGDGGRKELLRKRLEAEGCTNVVLLSPMKRTELIKEYLKADVLFLHLNDYEAFKKVLPSKVFEYATFGKPIWGGLSGYAASFSAEIENVAIFHPCYANEGIKAFRNLRFEKTFRTDFVKKYTRTNIMSYMAADILSEVKK